jgi:ribose transport system substrate-binding protein
MKPLHWIGVAALLLTGCGDTDKRPAVAFVSNNPEDFWNIAEAGAKKAADEFDVRLLFRKPPRNAEADQQNTINQVLNQNAKAIAVSVINPETQKEYMQGVAKKVILLTQDNDAPDCGRLCYIGTDNYAAGRTVGALVKQAMPDGGTIVILVGDIGSANAKARRQGVLDELAGAKDAPSADGSALGKYKLYKTMTDVPEGATKAKTNAAQALAELPREENLCLVGLWAYNPPAMLAATKDAGRLGKVKLVGFDENEATLQGIRDGHIHGTVVQQPYQFGYQSVKLMSELVRGDKKNLPKDGILPAPHLAVTKEGKEVTSGDGAKTAGKPVDAFEKELNALLGKK